MTYGDTAVVRLLQSGSLIEWPILRRDAIAVYCTTDSLVTAVKCKRCVQEGFDKGKFSAACMVSLFKEIDSEI